MKMSNMEKNPTWQCIKMCVKMKTNGWRCVLALHCTCIFQLVLLSSTDFCLSFYQFFQHPMNEEHCSDVLYILQSLGQIVFHRWELELTGNIIDMGSKIYDIAEYPKRKAAHWDHLKRSQLNYKYTFNMALRNYAANVPIVRELCDRQADGTDVLGSNAADDNFLIATLKHWGKFAKDPSGRGEFISDDTLKKLLQHLKDNGLIKNDVSFEKVKRWGHLYRSNLGAKTHHDLSDDLLEEVLKFVNETSPMEEINASIAIKSDLLLRLCDGCNKKESACGEFNKCNRCKNAYYCGRGKLFIDTGYHVL